APNMEEPYARIRTAMGLPAGADLGDAIAELNEDLGIPAGLKALGFDASRGAGVVKWAMKDLATFTNPKPLEQADFEALYEAAMV
ncbi:MAG: iron-containing alcohol dehydrogenase, partial [Pseudomonadota bacterium]